MNLKPSPWLFVLTAFSSITQGVALPDGSVAKRDLQLYTNPTYTSPFLGDRFRANPRSRNLDDQTLVTKDREARRLAKVQVWCNDYTVFSMQPWYHGNGGPQDYLHWQYADNRHGGAYQELIISDTEYISELQYDFCGDPGQKRLCFLYLAKDPLPGHESTGDNDGITCGSLQYDAPPDTFWTGQIGDKTVGNRGLLSFAGTVIGDKIIGLQTNWIELKYYLPPP